MEFNINKTYPDEYLKLLAEFEFWWGKIAFAEDLIKLGIYKEGEIDMDLLKLKARGRLNKMAELGYPIQPLK